MTTDKKLKSVEDALFGYLEGEIESDDVMRKLEEAGWVYEPTFRWELEAVENKLLALTTAHREAIHASHKAWDEREAALQAEIGHLRQPEAAHLLEHLEATKRLSERFLAAERLIAVLWDAHEQDAALEQQRNEVLAAQLARQRAEWESIARLRDVVARLNGRISVLVQASEDLMVATSGLPPSEALDAARKGWRSVTLDLR